ncbi:hypothetical protein [Senegalia massiliensis]|uniref:Uncharacterized protein n=1 Tax=Senegalia massiliensis TaxID=1720316 RepID=A0A845QVV3_9CLOT|nr:hypothetical protein [Senegalia massiliensis]NBI06381.1 hypothetical protein [Senegalia massiliensis]
MIKKSKKITSLIIVLLLLLNIYFIYNINKVDKKMKSLKHNMLARSDIEMDNALKNISTLNDKWEEISDAEKVKYLERADSNLILAMELMSRADKFFLPVKTYRDGVYTLEEKIINSIDENTQKEYIKGLENDFRVLSIFITNNFIVSDIKKEEANKKWKDEVKYLKTKEVKY